MHGEPDRKKILVVDDSKVNISILVNALKNYYELGIAMSGPKVLEYVSQKLPDLILLDIMMPDMDGYEVCARLKQEETTRDIPVVFITAMDEIKDKTRGFALGAVDYITKPFDVQEVLARVKTHLTLREQEIQLRKYATTLEQMVEERTRQLIHSDRLATLGTFAAAIIHEINNPNTFVNGNASLLKNFWSNGKPIMQRHRDEDPTMRVGKTVDKVESMLDSILEGSRRITHLVNSLRTYSRQGDIQKEACLVVDILSESLNLLALRLKQGVQVSVHAPDDLELSCDPQKLTQVFVNLIGNGIDAMNELQEKVLTIEAFREDDKVCIHIQDSGPGIAQETAEKIFDPFFTTKSKEQGTGLGLFIVRNIIEEHGGSISLAPSDGSGAKFCITFPLHARKMEALPERSPAMANS